MQMIKDNNNPRIGYIDSFDCQNKPTPDELVVIGLDLMNWLSLDLNTILNKQDFKLFYKSIENRLEYTSDNVFNVH